MMNRFTALLLLFFPLIANAGDASFTASVDGNTATAGEPFTLQLTLSHAEAKARPDISPLKTSFAIESQGQSSSTTIINGAVSSSTGWELALAPRTEGKVTIPPISIETSEGTLTTQPIEMNITHAAAAVSEGKTQNVSIEAQASVLSPYKNQPIIYTVKITARGELADLTLGDLAVDNAVIDKQGKPKIYDSVENGEPVKIIEVRYIVTPLAAGDITIPGVTLQGKMIDEQSMRMGNPFGQDFADPFMMLRNMNAYSGFGNLKAFTVASNPVHLNVKTAAIAMDPWLPLKSLTIREDLDNSQMLQVGDPVARKITLIADGGIGSQLPDLEVQQNHADFKVYADKPVIKETLLGDSITGSREESFSLIPQKEGKLVLPEIKVPWWNVRANRMEYAVLPQHVLNVSATAVGTQQRSAPQQEELKSLAESPQAMPIPPSVKMPTSQVTNEHNPLRVGSSVIIAIIGVLAAALIIALLWVVRLQTKVRNLNRSEETNIPAARPATVRPKQPLFQMGDIDEVETPGQLVRFLQCFAEEHFNISGNAPLETIIAALAAHSGVDNEMSNRIAHELSAAAYAGKSVDLEKLKNQCGSLVRIPNRLENDNRFTSEKLPKLNPS